MKKIFSIIVCLMLCTMPMYAQRSGGSHGSPSHSSSPRTSVSSSHPSSGSVSRTPSHTSSPSRSSSVSRTPSSTSFNRPSTPSRPSSSSFNRTPTQSRPSSTSSHQQRQQPGTSTGRAQVPTRSSANITRQAPGTQRTGDMHHPDAQGHQQPMHRPAPPHGMHPMPPMTHPMHHTYCHFHYHYYPVDIWMCNAYWNSYWYFYHSYTYDNFTTYAATTYNIQVIGAMSDENYIYSLINEANTTYFTITDKTDKVVVKYKVKRKYTKIYLDQDGCWIMTSNDNDPILFKYIDNNLYIYEE